MKKLVQVLTVVVLFALTFKANAQTTYTFTGGDLNNVNSWSPAPPAIPSGSADIWYVPITASVPYSDPWEMTAGCTLILGDGTTSMIFAVGDYIYSDDFSQDCGLIVNNNASLYIFPDDVWQYAFDFSQVTFNT